MRSVPNLITAVRLFLVPVFVVLLIEPSEYARYLATFIFIFAAFTDYLDGLLARRWGAVSNFGKLFDPLADKLLVMAALVMLTAMRLDSYGLPCNRGESCVLGASWVPPWMVVLILGREFWVTGLRAVVAGRGKILAAGQGGKLKSALQMTAIPLILVHDLQFAIPFSGIETTAYLLGIYILFFSIVVSYWSALEYSFGIWSQQRARPMAEEGTMETTISRETHISSLGSKTPTDGIIAAHRQVSAGSTPVSSTDVSINIPKASIAESVITETSIPENVQAGSSPPDATKL